MDEKERYVPTRQALSFSDNGRNVCIVVKVEHLDDVAFKMFILRDWCCERKQSRRAETWHAVQLSRGFILCDQSSACPTQRRSKIRGNGTPKPASSTRTRVRAMERIGRHRYSFLESYIVCKHKRTLAKLRSEPNRPVAGTTLEPLVWTFPTTLPPSPTLLLIPADSKPLPFLPAQIRPPQTAHTFTLTPLFHVPRRHLAIKPDLVQPPRV